MEPNQPDQNSSHSSDEAAYDWEDEQESQDNQE